MAVILSQPQCDKAAEAGYQVYVEAPLDSQNLPKVFNKLEFPFVYQSTLSEIA